MTQLDDLKSLWAETVGPALIDLEAERKKAISRFFWTLLVPAVALGLTVGVFLIGHGGPIVGFIGVAVIIAGVAAAFVQLQDIRKKAKAALLHPVIEALGYTHTEKGFERVGFDDCKRFKLLPSYDRSNFEDFIEGEHEGMRFQLYEAKLEEKRKSDDNEYWVTVFQGVIGRVEHDSSALGETVFARDGGWFEGKTRGSKEMQRASLGDNEFEDAFTVYTTDQVEARYLLPPNVMAHLAGLEKSFFGKKLRGAIAGGWLYFLIETKNLFEPGSMFKRLDDPERLERLLSELAEVRELIHALREVRP